MKKLLKTNLNSVSVGVLLVRVVVGLILFAVGAGKVFGWFGGLGLDITLGYYTKMGIPVFLAYLSIFTEFLGGLLLVLGFLTRFACLVIAINMLMAVVYAWPYGLFAGFALPLTMLACAIAVLLIGPMRYSVDHLLKGDVVEVIK